MRKDLLIPIIIVLAVAAAKILDIRESRLPSQPSEVEAAVTEIRQLDKLEDVVLNVQTQDEYQSALAEELEGYFSTQEAADRLLFYRALGLVAPDLDLQAAYFNLLSAETLGGYDHEANEITLILSSGQASTNELPLHAILAYAHQFTHALQDQHYDLKPFFDRISATDNYDLQLTLRALIDGDATRTMTDYAIKLWGADHESVQNAMDRAGTYIIAENLPSIIKAEFLFPYVQGLAFVEYIVDELGQEGADRAFRDSPPQSTEHIYNPSGYLDGKTPIPVSMPDPRPIIGEGWRLVYDSAVGRFYMGRHLAIHPPFADFTHMINNLRGDRMKLFVDDASGDLLWVWHQTWPNSNAAWQFNDGYRTYLNLRYDVPPADDRLCWTNDVETHCVRRIGYLETRIAYATDPDTARALLMLGV